MYKSRSVKSVWVLILFLMAGIVLFGFLAETLVNFAKSNGLSFLNWLTSGAVLGLTQPLVLDLAIVTLHLGFTIKLTVAGIAGMLAAYLIYRRI